MNSYQEIKKEYLPPQAIAHADKDMNCRLVQSFQKSIWQVFRKLGLGLPSDTGIPLLGIYPNDTPSYRKNIYSAIFIAVFFIIARN